MTDNGIKAWWKQIFRNMQKVQILKDLTDQEIANRMGVTRQRVGQIRKSLSGGNAVNAKTLHSLAAALEIDLQALIDLG